MNRNLLVFAALLTASPLAAQAPRHDGQVDRSAASDPRVMLEYAQFDPMVGLPLVAPGLRAGAKSSMHIVQFHATPTDMDRAAVERLGGKICGYMPHDCHLVKISDSGMALYQLEAVRWVGAYEPAYRLEPFLLGELASGKPVPTRRYNMVMADKRNDKEALATAILAMGGQIYSRHEGGLLFTADLNQAQLLQAARLDEVLWIDRWTTTGQDMDNARIQGGANYIETAGGYTGSGIIGHIYEGVESNHPDFNTPILQRGPATCSGAERHGHCTAGIVFGNGTSNPAVRGLAPDAVGFYTNYDFGLSTTCAQSPSRNTIIGNLINNDQVMFTTASWGNNRTFFYTSISADADDIVFDHRIPWTQSQSNAGNQDSRPQAWAKNVISVGGFVHNNNSNPSDDSWLGGAGSTGPAQDGRNKPDLSAYYDGIGASDLTGAAGYSVNNWTPNFGGTSGATPIVAGHNALAIQMYTDGLFQVDLPVPGGTRFENRPHAQTLKALQIACANMLTLSATDNRREHVGYGMPNLQNMYDRQGKISIIPEDTPITQGATHIYSFSVAPGESIVKFVMSYVDPAGNPAAAFDRVNDLSMRVTQPDGTSYWGNHGLDGAGQTNQSAAGGSADTLDTVEAVILENPQSGTWTVEVTAPTVTQDAYLATAATDATYALVVNGGTKIVGSPLTTTFASNNGGVPGGAVYFTLEALAGSGGVTISDIDLNCSSTTGNAVMIDVFVQPNTTGCTYQPDGLWIPHTSATGVSQGSNTPTNFLFNTPLELGEGCCLGVAIVATGFAHLYTNGSTNPESYTNGQLKLTAGRASNTPFSSSFFEPRIVNARINYALGGSCSDVAVATPYGDGCVQSFASFYEQMTQATMDLANLEIFGAATVGGHTVNVRSSTILAIGSLGAPAQLALGDDDSVAAGTLGLEVGSNGWVAYGSGNSTSWVPAVTTMLSNPAEGYYAWTDLQPNAAASGKVYYEESGQDWMVTYDGVHLYNTTDPVDIQFRGNAATRDFVIAFGALGNTGSQGWLVGHSGAGSSVDPGGRDLSQASSLGFFMADQDRGGLELAAIGNPVLGAPFQLQTTNIPAGAVFHVGVIGFSQINVPLAVAAPSANTSCLLYAAANVILPPQLVFGGPGSLTWQGVDLTNASALGFDLYFQAVTLDMSVLSGTTRTSNGLQVTTGLY